MHLVTGGTAGIGLRHSQGAWLKRGHNILSDCKTGGIELKRYLCLYSIEDFDVDCDYVAADSS